MKDNISPIDALKAELSIPTEEKPIPVIQEVVATDTSVDVPIEGPGDNQEDERVITPDMVKSEVDFALGIIDVANTSLLRVGVKWKGGKKLKRLFGDDAVERAELLSEGNKAKAEMDDEEKAILKVKSKIDDVVKGLPFSDQEKEMIRPLLEKYVIANKGNLPENFFAYLAMLQIFGGRVLNVLMI